MWYSASILSKYIHNDVKEDPEMLWEENIVLIEADNEQEARQKAEEIGKTDYVEYTGGTGDHIQFKFDRVYEVWKIDDKELKNGSEIFCRFLKDSEVKSLLKSF